MTTSNTLKTTLKSGKLLKTGLVGLLAAAGLGLLILPAKADEIKQDSVQTTLQEGSDNTSVQQSTQNANIRKAQVRSGRQVREDRSDKDVINQTSDQLTEQYGDGNTSVTQSEQNATIDKATRDVKFRRDRRDFHR